MKKLCSFLAILAVMALPGHLAANSVTMVFCSDDFVSIAYDIDNIETTPSIKIRDRNANDNSVTLNTSAGSGTIEGNFASQWSGSNSNLEAFLITASAVQSGAVARCPGG